MVRACSYFENGDKSYEGQYKNGHPHGHGIYYWENGNKRYDGQFENRLPHRNGIIYYFNGNKQFEGQIEKNIVQGNGRYYSEDGNIIYEGHFEKGLSVTLERKNKNNFNDNKTCSVCYDDFTSNNLLYVVRCNHAFHKGCINSWFTSSKTCPLCRESVIEIKSPFLPF